MWTPEKMPSSRCQITWYSSAAKPDRKNSAPETRRREPRLKRSLASGGFWAEPRGGAMKDRFGREIDYLRISVIDHCNLRCVYCMPLRGLSFIPSPELLSAAEIERVARAAVSVGFHKFRLTGGEPTLRPDIVEIVRRIAALPGVRDVAMTTN